METIKEGKTEDGRGQQGVNGKGEKRVD